MAHTPVPPDNMVALAVVPLDTALPLTTVSAVVLGISLLLAGTWLYYFLR